MSLSVIALLGALLAIFVFKDGMSKLHAFVAVLFGVYLGSTVFGGNLKEWTDNFFSAVGQMHF